MEPVKATMYKKRMLPNNIKCRGKMSHVIIINYNCGERKSDNILSVDCEA